MNLDWNHVQYDTTELTKSDMASDPVVQWHKWFSDANDAELHEPSAMALATADANGWPHVRNVMARSVDARGIVFFTNYESAKAAQIEQSPKASGLFSWLALHRQVRVTGTIGRVEPAESDNYFATRPRGSQLGAWASPQSELIASRARLTSALADVQARFGDQSITRPPFWGGYRLVPMMFEFWQGRPDRLHDRLRYTRRPERWILERLAP